MTDNTVKEQINVLTPPPVRVSQRLIGRLSRYLVTQRRRERAACKRSRDTRVLCSALKNNEKRPEKKKHASKCNSSAVFRARPASFHPPSPSWIVYWHHGYSTHTLTIFAFKDLL